MHNTDQPLQACAVFRFDVLCKGLSMKSGCISPLDCFVSCLPDCEDYTERLYSTGIPEKRPELLASARPRRAFSRAMCQLLEPSERRRSRPGPGLCRLLLFNVLKSEKNAFYEPRFVSPEEPPQSRASTLKKQGKQ